MQGFLEPVRRIRLKIPQNVMSPAGYFPSIQLARMSHILWEKFPLIEDGRRQMPFVFSFLAPVCGADSFASVIVLRWKFTFIECMRQVPLSCPHLELTVHWQ